MNLLRCSAAAIVVGLSTAACVNLDPVADETRFFTLGEIADGASKNVGDELRIGVRVVAVSDYLRKSGIVVRTGRHEITYSDKNRWADRLDRAIARVLVEGAQAHLPDVTVVNSMGVQGSPPDRVVEVSLSACEGTADGRAVLELKWRILGDGAGAGVRTGSYSGSRSSWAPGDFEQLAGLLTSLVNEAGAALAEDLRSGMSAPGAA